ncbi:MAG: hypothetical protein HC828_08565 [Blastochloris sp.]|nr:hypothetical protein [Blastochloris sp.]
MSVIIIVIIAATIIFARMASRPRPPMTPYPRSQPHGPSWHRRGSLQLLGRASVGLLIALLIIAFSNFPWPTTAGVWSAAMAADIASFQVGIWQHRDALVITSTMFWMLLPVWVMAIRLGLREGRALVRIGYLLPIWVYQQGRYVLARAAVGYHLHCGFIQPLWGYVTRWSHHGWWLLRFGAWSLRRTLVGCSRGAR